MSATGVPDRILRAYFVELDPIMILEKTVWEKLAASQSCEKPKMTEFCVKTQKSAKPAENPAKREITVSLVECNFWLRKAFSKRLDASESWRHGLSREKKFWSVNLKPVLFLELVDTSSRRVQLLLFETFRRNKKTRRRSIKISHLDWFLAGLIFSAITCP